MPEVRRDRGRPGRVPGGYPRPRSPAGVSAPVTDSATVAGDLRFARTNATSTAWAYLPSASPKSGDVWVSNSGSYSNPLEGTAAFKTMLHEVGHALGLKHPHEGAITANAAIDWQGMTVMSYRSYEGQSRVGMTQDWFASSPMYMDVKAMQYLYGANTSFNAGDTVYSWAAGEKILETIWDGAGTEIEQFPETALGNQPFPI